MFLDGQLLLREFPTKGGRHLACRCSHGAEPWLIPIWFHHRNIAVDGSGRGSARDEQFINEWNNEWNIFLNRTKMNNSYQNNIAIACHSFCTTWNWQTRLFRCQMLVVSYRRSFFCDIPWWVFDGWLLYLFFLVVPLPFVLLFVAVLFDCLNVLPLLSE